MGVWSAYFSSWYVHSSETQDNNVDLHETSRKILLHHTMLEEEVSWSWKAVLSKVQLEHHMMN